MHARTTVYFALRLRTLAHEVAAEYTTPGVLLGDLQERYLASLARTISSSNSIQSQCTTSQALSDLVERRPSDLLPQYCPGTAALTINVSRLAPHLCSCLVVVHGGLMRWSCVQAVLGNANLCWRACALWPPEVHDTASPRPRDLWYVTSFSADVLTTARLPHEF